MENKQVLAIVGDRTITMDDVYFMLQNMNPQAAAQFQSEAGMRRLVGELINQELFYLDAVDNGVDKEEGFVEELEMLRNRILKQYAINKLMKDVTVDEAEIKDFYDKNQSSFAAEESVKASHILVSDKAQAEEIGRQISGGLAFEDAASTYSSCPSREKGGDLGYFGRGMMVPEFDKAVFEMQVGQISAPVQTQFGYHLIRLDDKKSAGMSSFEEVRESISEEMLNRKQQQLYLQKVVELKTKYTIKTNI